MGFWNIDLAAAVMHSPIRVELTLKTFRWISNVFESAISTIPNAKVNRIFVLLGFSPRRCWRSCSSRCRFDLIEIVFTSAHEIIATTAIPTASGAASVNLARRNQEVTLDEAAHLQADHGEIVGIMFHRQLGKEDIPEIWNVDHVTERLGRRGDLDRLPIRSFHADVFDVNMLYQ